jgi:hypothetical protein
VDLAYRTAVHCSVFIYSLSHCRVCSHEQEGGQQGQSPCAGPPHALRPHPRGDQEENRLRCDRYIACIDAYSYLLLTSAIHGTTFVCCVPKHAVRTSRIRSSAVIIDPHALYVHPDLTVCSAELCSCLCSPVLSSSPLFSLTALIPVPCFDNSNSAQPAGSESLLDIYLFLYRCLLQLIQ